MLCVLCVNAPYPQIRAVGQHQQPMYRPPREPYQAMNRVRLNSDAPTGAISVIGSTPGDSRRPKEADLLAAAAAGPASRLRTQPSCHWGTAAIPIRYTTTIWSRRTGCTFWSQSTWLYSQPVSVSTTWARFNSWIYVSFYQMCFYLQYLLCI